MAAIVARVAAVLATVRRALEKAHVAVAFRLLAAILHFAAAAAREGAALRVAHAAAGDTASAAIRQTAVRINPLAIAAGFAVLGRSSPGRRAEAEAGQGH